MFFKYQLQLDSSNLRQNPSIKSNTHSSNISVFFFRVKRLFLVIIKRFYALPFAVNLGSQKWLESTQLFSPATSLVPYRFVLCVLTIKKYVKRNRNIKKILLFHEKNHETLILQSCITIAVIPRSKCLWKGLCGCGGWC